jgi:hypothetical protein
VIGGMALDLDALVNSVAADPDIFAVPFTYTPALGAPISGLSGIFDDAFESLKLDTDGGVPVTTTKPSLGVQLSAFPQGIAPAQNDQVQVSGNLYTVTDVQLDGLGWAQLMLTLAEG